MVEVPRCPGCGHNFYEDQPVLNGLCGNCVDEAQNPQKCHVCQASATCRGEEGYLCGSPGCVRADEDAARRKALVDAAVAELHIPEDTPYWD